MQVGRQVQVVLRLQALEPVQMQMQQEPPAPVRALEVVRLVPVLRQAWG